MGCWMSQKRLLSHAEAVEKLTGRPLVTPRPPAVTIPGAETLRDVLAAVLGGSRAREILESLDLFFESRMLEFSGRCHVCPKRRSPADYAVCVDVTGESEIYLCAAHEAELRRAARGRYRLIGWSGAQRHIPERLLELSEQGAPGGWPTVGRDNRQVGPGKRKR